MKAHPSLKPGIWGAVIGAAAITVIGFSSFGWTLGSTAERMARERAQTAVVEVLAPICVEKFQHQADASAKLIEFQKVSTWDRRSIIEKGGWAQCRAATVRTLRWSLPARNNWRARCRSL